MIQIARHAGRKALRALLVASVLALAASGAVMIAEPARAQDGPTAPGFQSDRLSVEVLGRGPDVIFVPGYASSREVWRAQAQRLAATHRVHLVQLAGFAAQPWTHGDGPLLQPAVDGLAAYVRQAGLNQPALIGHSMGGLMALMLAQQHPELVGRVLSVDSLPFLSALYGPSATAETARPFAEQAAAMMLNADADRFRAGQARGAAGLARDPATQAAMVEWSVASDRQALATAIREVMTTDVRPQLAAMTTPVWAVYAADEDGGAPAAMTDAMWAREYAGLSGVHLVRVDGSRHFIMADQPDRMSEQIDAFLAE